MKKTFTFYVGKKIVGCATGTSLHDARAKVVREVQLNINPNSLVEILNSTAKIR